MKLLCHRGDWLSPVRSCLAGSCRTWRSRSTVLLGLFGVLVASGASPGGRGVQDNIDLLQMVAEAHRANKEQIRTWRGHVGVETHVTDSDPESPSYHMEASVVFVLDRQKQAERSNWTTREFTYIDIAKGAGRHGMLVVENMMVKDGAYYRYSYDPEADKNSDKPIKRGVAIQAASARPRGGTAPLNFDPMYWFSFDGGDLASLLDAYCKWAKAGSKVSSVAVSRDGDLVVLESRIGEVLNRHAVDLQKGGNLVAYDAVAGSAQAFRCKYQYEKMAGAWVPKRVTIESTRQGSEGRRHRTHTVVFTDNVVNEPIAEEEFSLVKLGVRRGDQVSDTRSRVIYTIQGEEYPLPEPVDYAEGLRRPWTRFIMGIGTGLCVLVLAIVVWLGRRSRKGRTL